MYVLTGTTGGLGSEVLKSLLKLVPPSEITVSLYNPSSVAANDLQSIGVTVRSGDYKSPESLKTAFAGGKKLLIVSYPSIGNDERFNSHKTAIDIAIEVGIEHIYYTSLAFASDSITAVMKAHLRTEAYLKSKNVKYTIIREGIYSESIALYLGFFDPSFPTDETVIEIPGDGAIAWVARRDLGAGTAKLLTVDDYTNRTILLSGDKAYTVAETAEIVGKVVNKRVTTRIIPRGDYEAKLGKGRMGPDFAKLWSTTYDGLERGECATLDPLLQKLIGQLTPLEVIFREILLKS
jgi:uncharacterized protein YbjT (DUF2867 family)